jgi:hypothetical protein
MNRDMKDIRTKYEAQALAMTMVVLVVSAILGLSIYSRAMKDKLLTMEERASAEALEVADLTLDRLASKPIDDVVTAISVIADPTATLESGFILTENDEKSEITELLSPDYLGIITDQQVYSDLLSPICPTDVAGNEYQITLKSAEGNYEVKSGRSWGLPARNLLKSKPDEKCVLKLNVEMAGDSGSGFVVSKFYCEYDANDIATKCDEYKVNSDFVEKYCFSDNTVNCNNVPRFYDGGGDSPWVKVRPVGGEALEYPMSLSSSPTEIKVTAIGGTISVGYSFVNSDTGLFSPACSEGLRMYQLRATANCNGVYRGKEILIPEKKWHDSLFDYVIFNNEGPI